MRQEQTRVTVTTTGPGLYEITGEVADWLLAVKADAGLLTLFCRHTSASLTIQENADPSVQADLGAFFKRLVPEDPALYRHGQEGPDDMPAHIRSALTDVSLSVPVHSGEAMLGTWQGIYLFEHRASPRQRQVVLHYVGV